MIGSHIQLILIVTGVITATMFLQFLAPREIVRLMDDDVIADPVSLLVARHWGLLVGLLGALLVYAAFEPALRGPVVWVALIEKLALAGMLLSPAMRRRGRAASVAAGDLLMSLLYALYLAGF